MMLQLAENDRI